MSTNLLYINTYSWTFLTYRKHAAQLDLYNALPRYSTVIKLTSHTLLGAENILSYTHTDLQFILMLIYACLQVLRLLTLFICLLIYFIWDHGSVVGFHIEQLKGLNLDLQTTPENTLLTGQIKFQTYYIWFLCNSEVMQIH